MLAEPVTICVLQGLPQETSTVIIIMSLEERVAAYAAERERRVENFVQLVRARREQFIERACTANA